MKLQYFVGAMMIAFFSQSGVSQSLVTINVPGTAGCTITGVTSLAASGTNTFTATGGTAVNCGQGQTTGRNPPIVTTTTGSLSYTLSSGSAAPQFTWSAQNAVSCKATNVSTALFTNFAFTGPFPTSATALGQELCPAGANGSSCGGTVVATPKTGAVASANSLQITCTAPDASTASTGVSITLLPAVVGVPSSCSETDTGDLTGFTRMCQGVVSYSNGATTYGGELDDISQMFGGFPGAVNLGGQAAIWPIGKTQYISLGFIPTNLNTAKYTANVSWGAGGSISVSTRQGVMLPGSQGYVCGQQYGGSNSLVVSTNGFSSAQCKLTPGVQYYLNFANAGTTGAANCTKASCNMAYTLLKVN